MKGYNGLSIYEKKIGCPKYRLSWFKYTHRLSINSEFVRLNRNTIGPRGKSSQAIKKQYIPISSPTVPNPLFKPHIWSEHKSKFHILLLLNWYIGVTSREVVKADLAVSASSVWPKDFFYFGRNRNEITIFSTFVLDETDQNLAKYQNRISFGPYTRNSYCNHENYLPK